jgi:hypothetical protein
MHIKRLFLVVSVSIQRITESKKASSVVVFIRMLPDKTDIALARQRFKLLPDAHHYHQ